MNFVAGLSFSALLLHCGPGSTLAVGEELLVQGFGAARWPSETDWRVAEEAVSAREQLQHGDVGSDSEDVEVTLVQRAGDGVDVQGTPGEPGGVSEDGWISEEL
eukprot:SAG11_NODE_7639_length_1117_cov_1.353635_2_plen_104_part_00